MHTLTRTRTPAHARMRARAHTHTTRTRTQVNSRTRTQPSRTPEIGEQGLSQQLLNVVPVLIRNVILLGPQHVVLCFVEMSSLARSRRLRPTLGAVSRDNQPVREGGGGEGLGD